MRPRVFPAEDLPCDDKGPKGGAASMRPRVFPAEDDGGDSQRERLKLRASMRPRVFPAEDLVELATTTEADAGFNEAAGIPRGRPEDLRDKRIEAAELQ